MEFFEVEGGLALRGELQPQGAKNEALQVVSAVLLTDQPVTLHNLPNILDVNRLIELLEMLGVEVDHLGPGTVRFQARNIDLERLVEEPTQKLIAGLRGSVMILGPLLARYGRAYARQPGGDKIGRRRLDVHFQGFQMLGAELDFNPLNGKFQLYAPEGRLQGTYMLLEEASVTGTANLVMAACLAKGTTTLFNAACEPYVQQLCRLLTAMGARIQGIGSNLLTIEGMEALNGAEHTLLADMIEVGSFIGLAAMTQSEIRIKNADTAHLGLIPYTFRRLGIEIVEEGNDLLVPAQEICEIETNLDGSILTLADHTWPGLTPDLISVLLTVATQCKGTVLVHQKMFESRLFFTDKLIEMGAQIILCDPHRATVIGLARRFPLRGIHMTSPDIRAGVALLIAALSAQGTSRIFNIEQIDRGYQRIDQRLAALGARITRVQS